MIGNYICQIYVKCCYKCGKIYKCLSFKRYLFLSQSVLIVSILSLTPILNVLSQIFTPILSLLGISSELSPGILFSMIRKDGMLLFNLHQGALLQGMTATQLLLLVFFSSTFTACSVTMTMLLKHLGGQSALKLIGKQMVTSLSLVIGVGIIVKIVMLII